MTTYCAFQLSKSLRPLCNVNTKILEVVSTWHLFLTILLWNSFAEKMKYKPLIRHVYSVYLSFLTTRYGRMFMTILYYCFFNTTSRTFSFWGKIYKIKNNLLFLIVLKKAWYQGCGWTENTPALSETCFGIHTIFWQNLKQYIRIKESEEISDEQNTIGCYVNESCVWWK